jgi:glycosyltransferase involved in cell wall biosynthesis
MSSNTLFVINIISHYQVPLFSRLSKMHNDNIHVVSVRDLPSMRKRLGWSFNSKNIPFSYEILQEKKIRIFGVNFLFSPKILSVLFDKKYDVVVIGGYYTLTAWLTLFVFKVRGKKVVLRSGTHKYSESNTSALSKFMKRIFIKYVDSYVAYGTFAKEYLVSLGAKSERIFIEFDTVDVKFLREKCIDENCLNADKRNIRKKSLGLDGKIALYVGQLIERKNVITIIKTAEQLNTIIPELTFVIVGNGNQSDSLKSYVHNKNITNVQFVGSVKYEKVAEYYMAADVFMTMSVSDPYPLVINEAMSFGCPIIISRNCGNSIDLISNNGFVINDPYDSKSTAVAVQSIILDKELSITMAKESFDTIKKYDINNAANAIDSAIQLIK